MTDTAASDGWTRLDGDGGGVFVTYRVDIAQRINRTLGATVLVAEVGRLAETVQHARQLSQAPVIVADTPEAVTLASKLGLRLINPADWAVDFVPALEQRPWLVPAVELIRDPAPVRWLIDGWLQQRGVAMIHGPSGVGKSYLALDWSLRIATGGRDWAGRAAVTGGTVAYLAGEGHLGLRGRIAGWLSVAKPDGPVNLHVGQIVRPLDTEAGLSMVQRGLDRLDGVDLVVFDTVNRWMVGNDQDSQAAGAFLRNCTNIANEFGCSVLLVHHTGVSRDSQDRPRGSGAWRAGLENEIGVQPEKGGLIKITPLKSRDSELGPSVLARLEQVAIPGWGGAKTAVIRALYVC